MYKIFRFSISYQFYIRSVKLYMSVWWQGFSEYVWTMQERSSKFMFFDSNYTECSCDMSSDHHYSCHNNSSIYNHNEKEK